MATLKGTTISETYPLLLKIASSGVDGTLRNIEDGEGTASALQISSSAVNINGGLTASGDVNFDSNTLFVDASENEVMIGSTTSGRGKLSVVNTGYAVLALGTSSSSGSRGGAINFENETPATEGQILYDTDSDFMQFKTAGTVALTIDSSQNSTFAGDVFVSTGDARLGVGVTSIPHWGSGFDVLSVGHSSQYACETADGADRNVFWTNNLYYDGTGTYGYARHYTDEASMIQQRAGTIRFFTDASGTADADFNPSERMRINSSGRINATIDIDSGSDYLDGDASLYLTNSGTAGTIIKFGDTNAGLVYGSSGNGTFKLMQRENTAVFIDASRRVGIGETSPDGMLHIKKEAGTHHLIIEESSNTASRSWALSGAKGDLGYGKLGLYPGTSQGGTPGNTPTMTFLPTGEVGIGVASPDAPLEVHKAGSGIQTALIIENTNSAANGQGVSMLFAGQTGGSIGKIDAVYENNGVNDSDMRFSVRESNGLDEKMRIPSDGHLLIGVTSITDTSSRAFGNAFSGSSSYGNWTSWGSGSHTHAIFRNGTSIVGTITTSSSATAYNTSSDYRLKENEVIISDGLTRLNELKPYRFNFISDADTTVDGFFAHEVAEVVPEAVTGEKDAVDDDGNIVSQGIDQSKLVPLLVKALQEADDKIEALTARIEALENA